MSHPNPSSEYGYIIDCDTGVDHADEDQWRNYQLYTQGSTRAELLSEAGIAEVDQDGGELTCYGLDDARSDVYSAALNIINAYCDKHGIE